jgi:hypothetical protein
VRDAAKELIAQRRLLAEDLEAIVVRAGRLWDYIGTDPVFVPK